MQHVTDSHVDPIRRNVTPEERDAAQMRYLALAGMGCPNCAHRVRNALLATRGVVDVDVDLPAALATVWFVRREVRIEDLVAAVALAGLGTHHRYLAVPLPTQ